MHENTPDPNDRPRRDPRRRRRLPPNVVPLRDFVEVQRLMKKLNLTPADVLGMAHDLLADLDRQIEEEKAREEAPFPLWVLGGL